MRVDRFGGKTWLLAGIAGWALVVWLLGLFGMGGRLGERPMSDEALRLPKPLPRNAERIGPLGQYAEIGARPVFSEDRKPHPFTIDGTGDDAQANAFDYILTSVLITPGVKVAILKSPADGAQPVRVKLGEAVEPAPQWMLADIQPRGATFRGPDGEKVLELRVYDGTGAAPPPPVASTTAPIGPVINESPQPGQPDASGNVVVPPPPPAPAPAPPVASGGDVSTQSQLEAIRKRIEARRAQLRAEQQAQNQNAPGQTP